MQRAITEDERIDGVPERVVRAGAEVRDLWTLKR